MAKNPREKKKMPLVQMMPEAHREIFSRMRDSDGLTERQALFVYEYMVDCKVGKSAQRAGYSAHSASQTGARLMATPQIRRAIKRMQEDRARRTQVNTDWVLQRWRDVVEADPNDIMELRRGPCAVCWENTPATVRRKWTAVAPDPDCRKCMGDGKATPFLKDSRLLSGPARQLYAGVKVTSAGIEVKMHDRMAALAHIARHLGMFPGKVEVVGKDGGPIETRAEHMTAAQRRDEILRLVTEDTELRKLLDTSTKD